MPVWLMSVLFPLRTASESDLKELNRACRDNIWNNIDVKTSAKMLRRVNKEIDRRHDERIKRWDKAGRPTPWWEKKGPYGR